VWLTIDIGNSAIKSGLFSGDQIVETSTEHSVEEVLAHIIAWNTRLSFQRIGVCSVVPRKSELFISRIQQFTDVPVYEVGQHSPFPLQVNYTPPENLGTDRLVAACAAWHPGGTPQIIIDAGTAITIDAVSADGIFLGGAIMPGPTLTNQALADYTANLPKVSLYLPDGVLGNSTADAIQHGLLYGMIDGVLGITSRIRETFDPSPIITLTGGWHQLLSDKIPNAQVNPNLVLHGIRLLMELDTKST